MRFLVVDVGSDLALTVLASYGAEMRQRYGADAPYGPGHVPEGICEEGGGFLVGLDDYGVPVACAGFRRLNEHTAEIKSMFVVQELRRHGVGRELLAFIEEVVRSMSYEYCRLNTGNNQVEALNLYRSAGYSPIARYNDNPYASYWFEKSLVAEHVAY